MIVFEMPSHSTKQIDYINTVAHSCNSGLINFAISSNGGATRVNLREGNFAIEYTENQIKEPWVSMVELRANANKVATKYFNSEFRIMGDHNFVFKDGWEDYILEAVDDMRRFSKITGRTCYMGMGGAFGSYGHGRKPFLGPQPIFPCGRGIIYYNKGVWDMMEKLPCAAEEQYMTSVLFHLGYVPLRKMMSPIHHTMNTNRDTLDGIDADGYNPEIIRQIWNDPYWMFKPKYSSTEKPPDGKYYAHCPKNAIKAMIQLKMELSKIPGVEEFLKVDYGRKLKGKDLFA